MTEAVYREWSTQQAPLVVCTESTYGRRTNLTPQNVALASNRRHLGELAARLEDHRIPFMLLGGVDPVVRGADSEFCARNAVAISDRSHGYWVFYEGPEYGTPGHKDYLGWFARANRAIQAGDYAFQDAERETPHPLTGFHVGKQMRPFTADPMPTGAADHGFTMQFGQSALVLLEAGEELRARMDTVKLRDNRPP